MSYTTLKIPILKKRLLSVWLGLSVICQPMPNVLLAYQDSFGQYSFGYSTLNSARSEVKTINGVIRGAYSYIDENGMIQSTEYVADDDGFHVIATNLPQAPLPVVDTAEVIAARKDHLNALLIAEQMAANSGYEKEQVSIDSKDDVHEDLNKNNFDKEEISQKVNQEVNPKEGGNVSSLTDNKLMKINQLPVPVFKIPFGNQILDPTEKTLSVDKKKVIF
ncbi:hypothetical protein M0802_012830 [Mischocyttarus mexicanus]|nr:hypothetical protein M0802_012830 [Mischocyttarus mexicanus]